MEPPKKRSKAKTALIGGGIAAALAALLFKRKTVLGLLPGGSSETAPSEPVGGYTPPPVSNYDAPGPVANTATAVPVPPAQEPPTIDEAAEEAAAAAEAANIGGAVSDYEGPEGEIASDEERAVAEAGGGEAEGQEQAEAELREAAESSEGRSPEEAQIDDTIEQASNPAEGEQTEPVTPPREGGEEWNTWSGRSVGP